MNKKYPPVETILISKFECTIPGPLHSAQIEAIAKALTEQRDAGGREATNKILNRIKTTQLSGGIVAMKNREAILQALTPPTK